jgi:hypothetical protein
VQDPDNSERFVIQKEFNVWTVVINWNCNRDTSLRVCRGNVNDSLQHNEQSSLWNFQLQNLFVFDSKLPRYSVIFLLFNVVLNFRNKKWKSECMCWQPCSPPCTNLWHQMLLRTKRNLRERHQNVDWVSSQAALSPVSQLALTSVHTPFVTCTIWTTAAPWWVPCRLPMCWSCVQGVERNVQVWVDELSVMDLSYSHTKKLRCHCKIV